MPIMRIMTKPLVITSTDRILERLKFKPYRSTVERRVVPFVPTSDEPQTMVIDTPWGKQLTAKKGDLLVSELEKPDDYWPIDPVIFDESYVISRPGYCVKKAVTWLVPLTDVTNDPDQEITVVSLEGALTVRSRDFYLARGVKGEIWPYPREKVSEVLAPVE
jgi:hypothetical protein